MHRDELVQLIACYQPAVNTDGLAFVDENEGRKLRWVGTLQKKLDLDFSLESFNIPARNVQLVSPFDGAVMHDGFNQLAGSAECSVRIDQQGFVRTKQSFVV